LIRIGHRRLRWQGEAMIDHLSVQSNNFEAATSWYDAVFEPLGVVRILEFDNRVGYGPRDGMPTFWLAQATDPGGRQMHIAFTAPDRETVRVFFAVAVGLGSEVLHEPRLWPEYHRNYYGAFVRDPDGNNVEAVCHQPPL